MIEYTSPDGFTGQMYGKKSFRIVDPYGKEVFHTNHRGFNTEAELAEQVDGFPEFMAMLEAHWREMEDETE